MIEIFINLVDEMIKLWLKKEFLEERFDKKLKYTNWYYSFEGFLQLIRGRH